MAQKKIEIIIEYSELNVPQHLQQPPKITVNSGDLNEYDVMMTLSGVLNSLISNVVVREKEKLFANNNKHIN